jgi:hypothetical protein
VSPAWLRRRNVAAKASSRSASVHAGTTSRTRSIAAFSSSAPVGLPSGSTTTSAASLNSRAPVTLASASAGAVASAVWPSKKPMNAGESPTAPAIASARMPDS